MLIDRIVESLASVQGVKAIALGGSQCRGEADKQSDYDIGVYYEADTLDLSTLSQRIKELDDGHKDDLLNVPGQWGPWINGGAWLTFNGIPVDILLRDITRVEAVLKDCIEGKITIDYQPGHPFGFVNTIYAAETHYCKPLWQDKTEPLGRLKALLYSKGDYSSQMREAVIRKFIWEACFSLACGRKAALKRDVNYAMGSMFKAVCSWIEVLYALNNSYMMNEKGALKRVESFEIKPDRMELRIMKAYGLFANADSEKAYQILDELHNEVEALIDGIPLNSTEIR